MPVTIDSPYLSDPGAVWLRGNLHTHTTRSDGALDPQEAVDAYAALGHDFLAISDHNFPADLGSLDGRGMILLPGVEVTGDRGHVLAVGSDVAPPKGLENQQVIDRTAAAGGLAVLCHPDWGRHFDHYPLEVLQELRGYVAVEIYNGSIEEDPGSPYALDKWDLLLASGRRVWGMAVDDSHSRAGCGRGSCVVRARERSVPAILEALGAGSFYASTGAEIGSLRTNGSVLVLEAPRAEALSVTGEAGRRLFWTEGTSLSFDAADCEGAFFRVEAVGRSGSRAWTQPFGVVRA
ncbi:MAG: CehA/McbA family metallohydrolase [Planctomycetota bacterium]